MKTSSAGKDFIKGFESLKLKAYRCPAGVWTIGWGTTRGVKKDMEITVDEAQALFDADIAPVEKSISKLVKVPLSQVEFDALVSFEQNTGGLTHSTLLVELNAGRRERAALQFLRWTKATVNGKKVELKGLVRRRQGERRMFLGWPQVTP